MNIPKKTASEPVKLPNGTTVQIMGDVLGPYSAHTGFRSGDLGIMAPLNTAGEFALVFGDSFRGADFGKGEWMSPVGVVATMDSEGFIKVLRPLNKGNRVSNMIAYVHDGKRTLIPSDVINIGGTLYLQGIWNEGLGNVSGTQIWSSKDNGATWKSEGITGPDYIDGKGDLITWEKGKDGYIYVLSTSFKRADPVYLSRFKPKDVGNRSLWELYSFSRNEWGKSAEPVLNDVKAGEMSLRYIDGHWVLVMFNEKTLAIEVRVSDTLTRNWDEVPVATIAKHGPWTRTQSPTNWSQPYGGYIVPGSTLKNMDIVVSQWNTGDNSRYMSTQFNVKGLDAFFGIDTGKATQDDKVLTVKEHAATETPDMVVEDAMVEERPEIFVPAGEAMDDLDPDVRDALESDGLSPVATAAIVLGLLAGVGALGVAGAPLLKDAVSGVIPGLIPAPIAQYLPR